MSKANKAETAELTETQFDTAFISGTPVKTAFLHQAFQCPGLPSERSLNQNKLPGVEMKWSSDGLLIKYKGRKVTIPAANVATCEH
jgi:hypothetical protein